MDWNETGRIIVVILQILILISCASAAFFGEWFWVGWGLFSLFVTFIPAIVQRDMKMQLPVALTLVITIALYLHQVGNVNGWYITIPGFDKIAHFTSCATIAVLAFTLVYILNRYTSLRMSRELMVIFVVLLTISFGVIWEIGEYTGDLFFDQDLQHGNDDTMGDLVVDGIGALIIGLISYFYLLTRPDSEFVSTNLVAAAGEYAKANPYKAKNKKSKK